MWRVSWWLAITSEGQEQPQRQGEHTTRRPSDGRRVLAARWQRLARALLLEDEAAHRLV